MKGIRTIKPKYSEKDDLKSWRLKLHEIIFEADTFAGKLFDILLLVAILLSVVAVMMDSVPSIHAKYEFEFKVVEWALTIIFSFEYIARIVSVRNPWKYIFSFYGIIDLLSILPTFIGIFITGTHSLVVLRSLRLLRVFRVLKMINFIKDAQTLAIALKASRNKIVIFLFVVLTLVLILGTTMYIVESAEAGFSSIPTSIYWAIVTLTTVGYGDIAPVTPLGQFIASCIMIIGYAIIAVPTGIVTNELLHTNKTKADISTQVCTYCTKEGHDADAVHCKYCGHQL